MEFGTFDNNYLILPDPASRKLNSEVQVYTYLLRSPTVRQNLYAQAYQVRRTSYDDVCVHHEHLLLPLIITYVNAERNLLNTLHDRLGQYVRQQIRLSQARTRDNYRLRQTPENPVSE